MEVNAENLAGLSNYLQQTLKPEVHLRKPAEDFLKNVEKQKGYSILLLTLLSPENAADPTIKVAAAIAFKNFIKRNWKVVSIVPFSHLYFEFHNSTEFYCSLGLVFSKFVHDSPKSNI
jgi:hypothetical protein